MTLRERFDQFEDEFLNFELVDSPLAKLTQRPDLVAFMLLDKILPGGQSDIVGCAEHDEIWLNIDCEALDKVASDDDILMLVRCGVNYDDDTESLGMYV